MTRIKICGITNVEDARAAVDYGADALGFIFVRESPRYVGANRAALDTPLFVPPFVSRVAVCRSPDALSYGLEDRFDTIQYYEDGAFPSATMRRALAVRVRDAASLAAIQARLAGKNPPHALLLDTHHDDKLGGSGATFDWSVARDAKDRFALPIILAGGLTPDNVAEAIAIVRPYAVNVSSGVEAEPGRKDLDKLRAFIHAVRRADEATS